MRAGCESNPTAAITEPNNDSYPKEADKWMETPPEMQRTLSFEEKMWGKVRRRILIANLLIAFLFEAYLFLRKSLRSNL